ncbi:MAG: type I secretion protein [Alphaproteobacteria bacterium]|nr:MAG: type I secretion protein [Alphaproteobacteria bacterium]
MPAYSWVDNFYIIDPAYPPPPGTPLTAVDYVVVDKKGDGQLDPGSKDTIDGTKFYASWVGDTVTVQYPDGTQATITGVTFYLNDGREVFSPIDGSTLQDATFVSSSYVTTSQPAQNVQLETVVCFTAGTRIAVPGGERAVEELEVGDLVLTLDHGPQPLRWIGRRKVAGRGDFAPVRFAPGAIGNARELRVSPQHRMLVRGWRAELHFGEAEVLAPARGLVDGDRIHVAPCEEVEYVHLLFDRHEIVFAEGAPSESFFPGEFTLRRDRAIARELAALFPELFSRSARPAADAGAWTTARPVVRVREAALLA